MRKVTNRVLLGLYVGGIVAIAATLLAVRLQLDALL